MLKGFTRAASSALSLARQQAGVRGATETGSNHLLFGLSLDPEGRSIAARVMAFSGIEFAMEPTVSNESSGAPPFSAECLRTLELAFRKSRESNEEIVGTGHLMLAILDQSAGSGFELLRDGCSTIETLKENIQVEMANKDWVAEESGMSVVSGQPDPFEASFGPAFSETAQNALALCNAHALLRDGAVQTLEDLVVGLLSERDGVAAMVLASNGVSLDVDQSRLPADRNNRLGVLPSSEVLMALAESIRLATENGHATVGTGHLLISVLAVGGHAQGDWLARCLNKRSILIDQTRLLLGQLESAASDGIIAVVGGDALSGVISDI